MGVEWVMLGLLGIVIGAASGTVQYFLLSKFTGSVTGGKFGKRTVLFAITQFLFPFSVLVICALFLSTELLMVGIGMAASLVICAVVRFFIVSKAGKK